MDASPFARLSPELRNLIYEFAFTASDNLKAVTLQNDRIQHGITKTCRQIRRETLTMYYSMTRFNAHLDDGPSIPLARWLKQIGREHCLLLDEINIWDMHMLNATLHGEESTLRLLRKGTEDGKRYVLQPTGPYLMNRAWYLKDLVIIFYALGLELKNFCAVEDAGLNKTSMTSHFAIVPALTTARQQAVNWQHPEFHDLLAHLGFSDEMADEVNASLATSESNETTAKHDVRIRRGRRDTFLSFEGSQFVSIRQTFIPREESILF